MFHLVHGDVGGVRIPEHDHAEGIADQNERHSRFIQQAGHGKIISGQGGNAFSARFHGAQGIGGDFGPGHRFNHCGRGGTRQGEIEGEAIDGQDGQHGQDNRFSLFP